MWELNHKEGRAPNNWWFQTVVLAKTLESPLDSKVIKPVNLKENQPWIFIGRIDAEAETPILRPPDVKSWLVGKDPDAEKDWRQKKSLTEDKTVGETVETVADLFLGAPKSLQMVTAAMKLKEAYSLEEKLWPT